MNPARGKNIQPVEGVHLWLLLWKAARGVERQAQESIGATGLCLTDFAILEALLHKGPLPVNAFRERVLLTSGSMTAAVDRLERAGWVRRGPAPEDRRTRLVHLTTKGRQRIGPVFEQHMRDMEEAFLRFSGTERRTLARLLRKLLPSEADAKAGMEASQTRKGEESWRNRRK